MLPEKPYRLVLLNAGKVRSIKEIIQDIDIEVG
jgi:hypothetical protein